MPMDLGRPEAITVQLRNRLLRNNFLGQDPSIGRTVGKVPTHVVRQNTIVNKSNRGRYSRERVIHLVGIRIFQTKTTNPPKPN